MTLFVCAWTMRLCLYGSWMLGAHRAAHKVTSRGKHHPCPRPTNSSTGLLLCLSQLGPPPQLTNRTPLPETEHSAKPPRQHHQSTAPGASALPGRPHGNRDANGWGFSGCVLVPKFHPPNFTIQLSHQIFYLVYGALNIDK